jgi:hypothetical protein
VLEKFSCRACEMISEPPAPSHPIARGRAGPRLQEGIELDVSTPGRLGQCLCNDADAAGRDHTGAGVRGRAHPCRRRPVLDKGKTCTMAVDF